MSFLKEGEFTLPNGDKLAIRELSAGGRLALFELDKPTKESAKPRYFWTLSAVTVKHGVPQFAKNTVEEVLEMFPNNLLSEIAAEVMKLTGALDEAQAEKN